MTCWPPISVRCWPLWASSGARVDTAGEHLTGGRRLSWCACSGVWVSRAAGAGPSPGSCGGWAAVPLTALRAPFTLMMPFHPSPVRMTTSDRTWLGSVGQICSPPASKYWIWSRKTNYDAPEALQDCCSLVYAICVNSLKQDTSDLQWLPDFSTCILLYLLLFSEK